MTTETDRHNMETNGSIDYSYDDISMTTPLTPKPLGSLPSLPAEHPMFKVVHISGIVSLGISILVSCATLIYMLRTGYKSVWKRRTGERLVIYLAICDLLYSTEHVTNHAMTMVSGGLPDNVACVISAFILQEFFSAQSFIVFFSAFSAFLLVTRGIKVNFGKYDWVLLLVSFGGPAVLGTVVGALGLLGPSGYWCLIDMRKDGSVIVYNIYAGLMFATTFLDMFFYGCVWHRIAYTSRMLKATGGDTYRSSGGKMVSLQDQSSYNKTAQILTLFVAAYLIQWWPFMLYAFWAYFAPPHIIIVEFMVVFDNLGGVFNFVAYTLVRRIGSKASSSEEKDKENITMSVSLSVTDSK